RAPRRLSGGGPSRSRRSRRERRYATRRALSPPTRSPAPRPEATERRRPVRIADSRSLRPRPDSRRAPTEHVGRVRQRRAERRGDVHAEQKHDGRERQRSANEPGRVSPRSAAVRAHALPPATHRALAPSEHDTEQYSADAGEDDREQQEEGDRHPDMMLTDRAA